tara:strand:- start:2082 stop:2324 length:243 start_codon:yes stop_codon:yes gene_type:complete
VYQIKLFDATVYNVDSGFRKIRISLSSYTSLLQTPRRQADIGEPSLPSSHHQEEDARIRANLVGTLYAREKSALLHATEI